jgi:hypothetical protein
MLQAEADATTTRLSYVLQRTALGAEDARGLASDPRVSIVSIVSSSVLVSQRRGITLAAGPGRTFPT